MSTYRELIYTCLDNLKLTSDDAMFNEEHVMFLLNKFRGFILKNQYKDIKKEIPESNYQTICLDLEAVPAIAGLPCEGGEYLKSKQKIPSLVNIDTPRIYPKDYYQGNITYVSKERMRYVGHNKWLTNIIYASLGPDNYLYFKSSNPQYLYLKQVQMNGIFEDPEQAVTPELSCDKTSSSCDPMDAKFPLEESLIPQLLELVIKFLSSGIYKPADNENNSNDDLADMATFLRTNLKSNLQKQIES